MTYNLESIHKNIETRIRIIQTKCNSTTVHDVQVVMKVKCIEELRIQRNTHTGY